MKKQTRLELALETYLARCQDILNNPLNEDKSEPEIESLQKKYDLLFVEELSSDLKETIDFAASGENVFSSYRLLFQAQKHLHSQELQLTSLISSVEYIKNSKPHSLGLNYAQKVVNSILSQDVFSKDEEKNANVIWIKETPVGVRVNHGKQHSAKRD
jgi:hypothetical protein